MAEIARSMLAQQIEAIALQVAYERRFPGLEWAKASPQGLIDARSRLSPQDVLTAIDVFMLRPNHTADETQVQAPPPAASEASR